MDRLEAHIRSELPYLQDLGQILQGSDESHVFKPEGEWPCCCSKGHWVELMQVRVWVVLLLPVLLLPLVSHEMG